MNARKIALFAFSAAIAISGAAVEASARNIDDSSKAQITAPVSCQMRSILVGERAARISKPVSINDRVALNPQPLPPGERYDEYDEE
ncbi:MAG: hypothetical protein WAK03_07135 [Methylocystis sp.]